MKITKHGLDMSAHVVDMTCDLCGAEFEASADPEVREALVYDSGEIAPPGQKQQLRGICQCPSCGAQCHQAVTLRELVA